MFFIIETILKNLLLFITMFRKYLIIASKKDLAGINITTHLSQLGNYDFYLRDEEIISDANLNHEKINQYDFVIFASKHQSAKKMKTLSVHAPGNWRAAELGGKNETLCSTSALFLKQAFQKLKSNSEKYHLKDYDITLECTHHGPLIERPCIFIEIGATETEWKDSKAGFVVAQTISDIIENFNPNPYNEIAFAIGGPHYCPNFNKIQLNSNYAVGHIIPSYALPLKEEMIKQVLEKTKEEIDLAILDWKGLGTSEMRKQTTDILDKFYIRYEKTSDISK
jgi:D-tyrosyl-tRNA(Tyr) deacylase